MGGWGYKGQPNALNRTTKYDCDLFLPKNPLQFQLHFLRGIHVISSNASSPSSRHQAPEGRVYRTPRTCLSERHLSSSLHNMSATATHLRSRNKSIRASLALLDYSSFGTTHPLHCSSSCNCPSHLVALSAYFTNWQQTPKCGRLFWYPDSLF